MNILVSILIIKSLLISLSFAFPPAISFSPYKFPGPVEHHSICKYCLCDQHQKSVICAGAHIIINTVHLPSWTTVFHVHNVSLSRLPHFGYSPELKVLRINYCGMKEIHPLSFVPLPNLETIHFADNEITGISETLFGRLEKLRIINLARNKIQDLNNVELSLPDNVILDQLVLDGNPIEIGVKLGTQIWPKMRQLHMSNTRMEKLNGTHIVFEASESCPNISCRTIIIPTIFWTHLVTADFGQNSKLEVHPTTMPLLANLTALNLASTEIPVGISTLFHPEANLRHLDLHGAKLGNGENNKFWQFCSNRLEWLDISKIGLTKLHIGNHCTSLQWLFASSNKIESAIIDARGLRVIHMDRNRLTEWPFPSTTGYAGKIMPQLETLSISHNRLGPLPKDALKGFPSLTTLDISSNNLLTIHRYSFPEVGIQLRYLNLSSNLLRSFPTLILPKLQVLDLSSNDLGSEGIDEKAFVGMPSLQHLHLSKNPNIMDDCIFDNDFEDEENIQLCWMKSAQDLQKLVELDIAECDIKKIYGLKGFKNLQSLNLAKNEMTTLDCQKLPPSLVHLNLRGNRLHHVANLSLSPVSATLQDLDIAENPLRCDCSLFEISKQIQRQPDYSDRSLYYCFAENWQHPLKSYLDSAENFCESRTEFSPTLSTLIINFAGLLITCLAVAAIFACIILKAYRAVDCKLASYAPVPQSETPVDV
uniref:LRRCT domain-containing protein n=1 Tax=Panagrolaimus sp. ES5 TaxID=591445 RepID=A0AC34F7G1_9BILA